MDNVLQALSQIGDITNTQAPVVGPIRRFNQQTFGTPDYANSNLTPEQRQMALVMALGMRGGGEKVSSPLMNRATKLVKGKIMPQDIQTFGKFGEMVETGKARGNLGQVGQDVQSFIGNVFGERAARTWSNKQVKEALDLLLKQTLPKNY